MAEIYGTESRRHLRPVDVFCVGIVAIAIGAIGIVLAAVVALPPDVSFGLKLSGYAFLAVGATAAALAILRQEDIAEEALDGRYAKDT